jgi:hypothetical protein
MYRALFEKGLLSREHLRTDIKLAENPQLQTGHEED